MRSYTTKLGLEKLEVGDVSQHSLADFTINNIRVSAHRYGRRHGRYFTVTKVTPYWAQIRRDR